MAAALPVLKRRAEQRLEQFQAAIPVGAMHTDCVAPQNSRHALHPKLGRLVRLGHTAGDRGPVGIPYLFQAGPDEIL